MRLTVQQKVEMGTWQERSVSLLPVCGSRPGLWYPVIPQFADSAEEDECDVCKCGVFAQLLIGYFRVLCVKAVSSTSNEL